MEELIQCVLENDEIRLKALLERIDQDKVNEADNDGFSAMHYAALYNEAGMVRALLAAGASAQRPNRRGNSPAHVAVANGAHVSLQTLLEFEPQIALLQNVWGETPAHIAAHSGDVYAAALLAAASHGQPWRQLLDDSADQWGRSPAQVASDNGFGAEFGALLAQDCIDPAHYAVPRAPSHFRGSRHPTSGPAKPRVALSKRMEAPLNEAQFQQWLADPSVDLNGADFYGLTAAHKLAAWNKPTALAALLSHPEFDRSLLERSSRGAATPLVLAIEAGARASAAYLLRHPWASSYAAIPSLDGQRPSQLLRAIQWFDLYEMIPSDE